MVTAQSPRAGATVVLAPSCDHNQPRRAIPDRNAARRRSHHTSSPAANTTATAATTRLLSTSMDTEVFPTGIDGVCQMKRHHRGEQQLLSALLLSTAVEGARLVEEVVGRNL